MERLAEVSIKRRREMLYAKGYFSGIKTRGMKNCELCKSVKIYLCLADFLWKNGGEP